MKFKNLNTPHYRLLLFAFLLTIVTFIFYTNFENAQLEIETKEVNNRAELILKKIAAYKTESLIMSRFIQVDIQENFLSQNKLNSPSFKKEVENRLEQYLRSTTKGLIYGIGIWFEPSAIKNTLFGPYIYLSSNEKKPVLTYEWNTQEYNYPSQSWYQAGVSAQGRSQFVNPYFDSGLVYVTNSRAFYLEDKLKGVITVDITIPQLQDFIIEDFSNPQSFIYITNQKNFLLAHPQKLEFFKKTGLFEGQNGVSLLNYQIHDFNKVLNVNIDNWEAINFTDSDLGWKVVVVSSKDYLYRNLRKIKNAIFIFALLIWFFTFLVIKISIEKENEKNRADLDIEKNRLQMIQSSKFAALGEMAGGVAHEINNPLAIILARTQLARAKLKEHQAPSDFMNAHFDLIEQTVQRISNIVKGLKAFSRSGENDPFVKENLASIIHATVSICLEKFKSNQVALDVDTLPDLQVFCRNSQLSQVLLNLLSNSFDAIQNLDQKWVRISMIKNSQDRVQILVTDSGYGINPEVVEKMMQPFFTTKEVNKGTGLGLSISKSLIEDHKGKLFYKSGDGHTTFVIELPLSDPGFISTNH